MAKERGAKLVISTDAHNRYQLQYLDFGIGLARRAWLRPQDIVNALPLKQLQTWLDEH
jgi:DNA polymerase (family 10)